MSNNLEIVKHLQRIYEHIYLRSRVESLPPERLLVTPSEHEKIFQMIETRDIGGAKEILGKHVREAKNVMMMTLTKEEDVISFSNV